MSVVRKPVRRAATATAVALAFGMGAAASAQDTGTGTLIRGRQMSSSPLSSSIPDLGPMVPQLSKTAVAVGRQVAACTVRSNESGVLQFLHAIANGATTKNYDRVLKTVTNCLSSQPGIADRQMAFSYSAFYSLLSEAWILRHGSGLSAAEPVPVASIRGEMAHDASPEKVLQSLTFCLAKTHPAETAALLATQPGSEGEQEAFVAIGGVIPTCLDRNITLKTSRSLTRLALASTAFGMGSNGAGHETSAVRD